MFKVGKVMIYLPLLNMDEYMYTLILKVDQHSMSVCDYFNNNHYQTALDNFADPDHYKPYTDIFMED